MPDDENIPGESPAPLAKLTLANADAAGYPFHTPGSGLLFKVTTGQSHGGLLLLELYGRGFAPAEHLHLAQDEFFYVLEGLIAVKTGGLLRVLYPGDSIYIPRQTPHAYAFSRKLPTRMLIAFTPALQMEEYLLGLLADEAFHDDAMLARYGMMPVGPPIGSPLS